MRIGIYGGAFNPIHYGHIKIAAHSVEELKLDKLLIMPSRFSPHKSNGELVSDVHRFKMCDLAFGDIPKCEVSDIELKRQSISYTVDTLTELKTIYPFDEIILICGSDMFLSLLKWREPEKIFEMASLFAFRRNGEQKDVMEKQKILLEQKGAKVYLAEFDVPAFSSTILRENIKCNKSIENMTKKSIIDYINDNKLYKF